MWYLEAIHALPESFDTTTRHVNLDHEPATGCCFPLPRLLCAAYAAKVFGSIRLTRAHVPLTYLGILWSAPVHLVVDSRQFPSRPLLFDVPFAGTKCGLTPTWYSIPYCVSPWLRQKAQTQDLLRARSAVPTLIGKGWHKGRPQDSLMSHTIHAWPC